MMSSPNLDDLRERLRATVVTASDIDYNAARAVHNGMIDKHPLAVVRVTQVADVLTTVAFARDAGIDLAIRGGGHSGAGFGTTDGGIVLDFSRCRGVRVDPRRGTAQADAGTTWCDFNFATHAFGLATTGGIVGTTGIAGLTLGGGIGYLTRKHGLSCDNLLSADVVTADGRLVNASETENDDLFWALRGGGGNFGVVTSFEYRVHPMTRPYVGVLIFSADDSEQVGRVYREYIAQAPEDFGAFFGYHLGAPSPYLPERYHGAPVCMIVGAWFGDPSEGEARWAPLLGAAPVLGSLLVEMPYPALNSMFDTSQPKGIRSYWKSDFVDALDDNVLRVGAEFGATVPTVQSAINFHPVDGAVHRVAPDATAFAYRNAGFSPAIASFWDNPADSDANIAWTRNFWEALHPYGSGGGYINFMGADDSARSVDNYGPNWMRLRDVKAKWDPDNVFHVNQNIPPADAAEDPAAATSATTPSRTA